VTRRQNMANQRGVICLPVARELRPVVVSEIPF
jgi:hypothetical protein